MQHLARIAADFIVMIHAGYVAFVVVGQLLILLGWLARWQWIRNVWFRGLHLTAIVVVVLESWFGIVCPLTTLEQWLRVQGGETTYRGDFLGQVVHDLLFFDWEPWVFTTMYTVFGGIIVLTLLFVPPRRKSRQG